MSQQFFKSAKVDLPTDLSVRVVRSFNAPVNLVYRAYVEPDLLKQWMLGPPGWSMPVCEMDIRVRGKYNWLWRNEADGSEFGFTGEFREVIPEKRLHQTQLFNPGTSGANMGDESYVKIDFVASIESTTFTTIIEFSSMADRDQALSTGMTDGMEMSYQQLETVLDG